MCYSYRIKYLTLNVTYGELLICIRLIFNGSNENVSLYDYYDMYFL